MEYYKDVTEHVKMIVDGLSDDLGVSIIDKTQINLDRGDTTICYTIGDNEPTGINSDGQQSQELEIELQIFVPTSHEDAQLYTLGISSKICELLLNRYYGLEDQRTRPEIEANVALNIKGSQSAQKSILFVARSIVFHQTVYTGPSTVALYSVEFGVEYEQ